MTQSTTQRRKTQLKLWSPFGPKMEIFPGCHLHLREEVGFQVKMSSGWPQDQRHMPYPEWMTSSPVFNFSSRTPLNHCHEHDKPGGEKGLWRHLEGRRHGEYWSLRGFVDFVWCVQVPEWIWIQLMGCGHWSGNFLCYSVFVDLPYPVTCDSL